MSRWMEQWRKRERAGERGECNDNKERLPEGENGRDIYCTSHAAFNYTRLSVAHAVKRDRQNVTM